MNSMTGHGSTNPNPKRPDIYSSLPDDIIYNIFLRLSVKDLLRLMSVCKSWLSLLSSRDFIETHLSKSSSDPHFTHVQFILNMGPYGVPEGYMRALMYKILSVYSLLNEPVSETVYLDLPMKDLDNYIVGYSHGLICVRSESRKHVCLWNPSTRKSRILPKLDEYFCHAGLGFCYDESNDDFKVFAIFGSYDEFKVSVYSLKSDSWRIVGDFPFGPVLRDGKFANGAIHWGVEGPSLQYSYGDELKTIVSFDIKTEMYREVLLPIYGQSAPWTTLGTFDKSLSILYIFQTYADLWVMKECGMEESWTKLFTIPCMNGIVRYHKYLNTTSSSVNGNIILNFGWESRMELYYPKEKIFKNLLHDDRLHLYSVDTYVESLVSPHP